MTILCAAVAPYQYRWLITDPASKRFCAYEVSNYGFVDMACIMAVAPDRTVPSTDTLAV